MGRSKLMLSALLLVSIAAGGCSLTASGGSPGQVTAVGAENEYANVISQIGGRYVSVRAIMNNPATDPHTFESSPQVASMVSSAQLVVQNGAGYDDFMTQIENATPSPGRSVINVQTLLGLPDTTPNPHFWYEPTTMPKVAAAIVHALSRLQPSHRQYFEANLAKFDTSLRPWLTELSKIKSQFAGAKVATTEPVADYMLEAAGLDNSTPFSFQADVMNGLDPSPQGISLERDLVSGAVRVFVYNQQVTDSLTLALRALASAHHVPVVGVYETMPTPGYGYQSWMLAEATALYQALANQRSAPQL